MFVFYVLQSPTLLNSCRSMCEPGIPLQPVHVVYTDYRPTPLQHYIFPSNGDGVYLIIDEKGKFRVELEFRYSMELAFGFHSA